MQHRSKVPDNACLVQRLHRLLNASSVLQQQTIRCLHRLTVLCAPLDHEDIAGTIDRLAEVFNAHSFLTRCNGWHDIDDIEDR